MKNAKLGLSRKDINLLLSEVDLNGDGEVSYDEFLPLCFDILVERFKFDMIQNKALQSGDDLTQALIATLQASRTPPRAALQHRLCGHWPHPNFS